MERENNKTRLYKGIFSVILIATIMTIFELLFYIFIVNPSVVVAIKSIFSGLPQGKSNPKLDQFLKILNGREEVLINDINLGGYVIIIVEIFLMFALLSYVYMRILVNTNVPLNLGSTFCASFFTLFILISFQVMFFFFGLNYYYMGRFGIEEPLSLFAEIYLS